jgi:SulP family sulfate permease
MTGFITGAGLLIILGQLSHLTGYETEVHGVLPRFYDWLIHFNQSDLQTTLIGIMATLIIYFLHHTRFSSVATLSAMIITSVIVAVFGWQSVPLVRDMSPIPSALPNFVLPHFEYASSLLSAAFALAVLSSVQSAALVANISEPDGKDNNDDRDMIGQGLANVSSSFFQGMPSGGSLSRTAVNITAGAKTRLANILAGIFVGLTLLFLGSTIERITLAALAGHLIVAAISLIHPQTIAMVWNVSWSMLATFISTLVLPLEYSIYIGVGLSLALYIYSSAAWIQVVHLVRIGSHQFKEEAIPKRLPVNQAIVFSINGNLFFAAVRHLEELLPDPETANHTVVILRLRNNPYMGSIGLNLFHDYADALAKHNSILILAGIGEKVQGQLKRTDNGHNGHKTHLFKIFTADGIVFSATERALEYAETWLDPVVEGDSD